MSQAKHIESTVREGTTETVASLGFELCDVTFAQEADAEGWVLTLYIYRPDGVSIDDCEAVSRAVDPVIDQLDPIEEPYFLSVSSLGLDRPFAVTRDYERYLDKEIDIKLYAPVPVNPEGEEGGAQAPAAKRKTKQKAASKKEFDGVLRAVDDASVTIESGGQIRVFSRSAIAKACPHISW